MVNHLLAPVMAFTIGIHHEFIHSCEYIFTFSFIILCHIFIHYSRVNKFPGKH
jgi:hypothetical protein